MHQKKKIEHECDDGICTNQEDKYKIGYFYSKIDSINDQRQSLKVSELFYNVGIPLKPQTLAEVNENVQKETCAQVNQELTVSEDGDETKNDIDSSVKVVSI